MAEFQRPSIGRIVLLHFKTSAGLPLDGPVLPAIITRVWSDTCVNLRVFPDGHGPAPLAGVTSVPYDEAGEDSSMHLSWSWPPRV